MELDPGKDLEGVSMKWEEREAVIRHRNQKKSLSR